LAYLYIGGNSLKLHRSTEGWGKKVDILSFFDIVEVDIATYVAPY
jgi:hypothetical protein